MCVRPDPITQIVNRIGTVNYIYQPVLTWFEFCRSDCDRTSNFRCLSNYSLRYMLIFFKRTYSPCLAVRLCIVISSGSSLPYLSREPVSIFSAFHFPLRHRAPRVTLSFRDCKGKRSFGLCKINNFYFFWPTFHLIWGVQFKDFLTLSQAFFSLSFSLPPTGFVRWRAAKVTSFSVPAK